MTESSARVLPSAHIDDLGIDNDNVAICNAFHRAGIRTVADLLGYSEKDLLRLKGIGKAYVASIKFSLNLYGYALRKET